MEIKDNILVKVTDEDIVNGTFNIPMNVTEIGNSAFEKCINLKSIIIPDSVTMIGHASFLSCSNLEDICIPSSVFAIGDSSFAYCKKLKNIDIPDSVQYLGWNAFKSCENLKEITLSNHDNMKEIGYCTFEKCTSLESIIIPKNVLEIDRKAFMDCSNLKTVTIPLNTSVSDDAFVNCPDNIDIIRANLNVTHKSQTKNKFNPTQAQNNIKGNNNMDQSIFKPQQKNTHIQNNISPMSAQDYALNEMYEYANSLGLTPYAKQMMQMINTNLQKNNITEQKYLNDRRHYEVVKELLQCISNDRNYDYKTAMNYYIKGYIEYGVPGYVIETSESNKRTK